MFQNNLYSVSVLLILFDLFLFPATATATAAAFPFLANRYVTKSEPSSPRLREYVDPTFPPPVLPDSPPPCSVPLLDHDFANSSGSPPPSAPYSPPSGCPAPWARVVLELSVNCSGVQRDRIAGVWVGGVELLRTSTALPTETGVLWKVSKDVTGYSSLFRNPDAGNASMVLENVVDDVLTGAFHVSLSLSFYPATEAAQLWSRALAAGRRQDPPNSTAELGRRSLRSERKLESVEPDQEASSSDGGGSKKKVIIIDEGPADLIIPISDSTSDSGSWFKVESEFDPHFKSVAIPNNTLRAVLEIYASAHSSDEFWYANPPDSYVVKNNLTGGRGNGSFREVFATIDGLYAGSVIPFPVIYSGGVNPFLWAPVTAIGAFDVPSYHIELTPFLGLLLDGKPHEFGLGVTGGVSFWLVDANLHLWLDPKSPTVQAQLTKYKGPPPSVERDYQYYYLNGTFEEDAERKATFTGWVSSSLGNLTVKVDHKVEFDNRLEIWSDGNYTEVHLKGKMKAEVKFRDAKREVYSLVTKSEYPLKILISAELGDNSTYETWIVLTHDLETEIETRVNKDKSIQINVKDEQDVIGCMMVQDRAVLSGSGRSRQRYEYKGNGQCLRREVSAGDDEVWNDLNDECSADSVSDVNPRALYKEGEKAIKEGKKAILRRSRPVFPS